MLLAVERQSHARIAHEQQGEQHRLLCQWLPLFIDQ
jgi:hypothetical protein